MSVATDEFFQLQDAKSSDRQMILPDQFLPDRVQQAAYDWILKITATGHTTR